MGTLFTFIWKEKILLFVAQQNGFQCDLNHVVEGRLAFFRSGLFVGTDVVGNRTDGQRFRTELCCYTVDTGRFHFHAQNAVLFHYVEHLRVRRVEQVSREEVTYAGMDAFRFSGIRGVTHHVVIGNGRVVVVFETHTVHFGIRTGAHTDHDITQFDVSTHSTTRAHADDLFHAEIGNKIFGIDLAGSYAHTVAHHRDSAAFVSTGEAQHATHVVDLFNIFQERFSDVFSAQRVARHQNYVSEVAHCRINVWSCHHYRPLNSY